MSMKISENISCLRIYDEERLKEKQAIDRTEEAKETEKTSDKTTVPKDEYISSDKSGEKPSGLYRLGQDENGNKKLIYDDPNKTGNEREGAKPKAKQNGEGGSPQGVKPQKPKEEKWIGNTDKVEREIRELKEKKKELEQQIRSAAGDEEKVKELEKKLADIENELSQKDNDTYRRQNTDVTKAD